MKITTFVLATLTTSFINAVPVQLIERQTKAKTLIDPSLFPILQRYTRFAVASLSTFVYNAGTCPSPPFHSTLVAAISNTTTATEVAVFQDDTAKEFIVSFPGSDSLQDGVTDLNYFMMPLTTAPACTGCQVHGGVLLGWLSVRSSLISTLASLRAQYPDYKTTITGHSLGGGLASLTYTDLNSNNIPVAAAYTMGSLRVGNQAYADFTDKLSGASDTALGNFIRITHRFDGVPALPTTAMGFVHTRTEIYELDNLAGTQAAQTTYRCYGQEAPDCSRLTAVPGINGDHLMYTGVSMTTPESCFSVD